MWLHQVPGLFVFFVAHAFDLAAKARIRETRCFFAIVVRVTVPTKSKPGKIHLRIVEVMKRFPGGISGGQIRQELEREGLGPDDQTHLDRRKRDLKKWFVIEKSLATLQVSGKARRVTLYRYCGVKEDISDEGQVSLKERAEVIHAAHGRCQMCGKRVEQGAVLTENRRSAASVRLLTFRKLPRFLSIL